MDKHYNSDCNCREDRHNDDCCKDHRSCSCTQNYLHKSCCFCQCNHCSKDLCNTDFKIRLAGLQGGLNFRLRQHLWDKAEFELDNGNIIQGTIVFVGSNFVEVLVEEPFQLDKTATVDLDKELTQKVLVKEKDLVLSEIRHHKKGKTWIFSSDKIANVKFSNSHCR